MLNRQNKQLLAALICALFSTVAFAQQAATAAGAQATPAAPAPSAAQAAPAAQPPRVGNPLEEMSRLNAEIATLRAKLQVADIKSQIKKKEDEMAPAKVEKAVKEGAKPEVKAMRPPLPSLDALPKLVDFGTKIPKIEEKPMEPQLLGIEGVGDDLYAEIQTDWGGFARVRVNDKYHNYQIVEITPSYVKARDGKGVVSQLAMRTSAVQALAAEQRMLRERAAAGVRADVALERSGTQLGGPSFGMGAPMPTSDNAMMPMSLPDLRLR